MTEEPTAQYWARLKRVLEALAVDAGEVAWTLRRVGEQAARCGEHVPVRRRQDKG